MNTETFNKLVAYRVKKGYNESESIALLEELISKYKDCYLASSLFYLGFATELRALEVAGY